MGIGYDLGYHTAEELAKDWVELPAADLALLKGAVGLVKENAQAYLPQVAAITIPYDVALRQFREKTILKFARQTHILFPGVLDLPPRRIRRSSVACFQSRQFHHRRRPGRNARYSQLLILGDYPGVAEQIRGMKRLWPDMHGLVQRREAEAHLFETSLAQSAKPATPPASTRQLP